jgi:hypothetical protein
MKRVTLRILMVNANYIHVSIVERALVQSKWYTDMKNGTPQNAHSHAIYVADDSRFFVI